jgi:hypothetical protein
LHREARISVILETGNEVIVQIPDPNEVVDVPNESIVEL